MNLCQGNEGCISCCTRGIERFSKEELDKILFEHFLISDSLKDKPDFLKEYVKLIKKNRNVCEYLGFLDKSKKKTGCLIHPSIIGKEIRNTSPKNNFFRGKCSKNKNCNKDVLLKDLPEEIQKKVLKELEKSDDFLDYSIKIKHLIPRIYVKQKLKPVKLGKIANHYLNFRLKRITREPEYRQCFRLKARLDWLIKSIILINKLTKPL